MMLSTMQIVLMPTVFGLLFFLMILYWSQAAFFSYTKYKKVTLIVFFLSIFSLTGLLLLRWVESGHFPLSNLYESLLFLSWSFLISQLVLQVYRRDFLNGDKNSTESVISRKKELELQDGVLPISDQSTTQVNQDLPYSNEKTVDWGSQIAQNNNNLYFSSLSQKRNEKDLDAKLKLKNNEYDFIDLLGVIISPMALLTYGFAFLSLPKDMQKATALVPALQSNWLMMHVSIMILSYAALLSGSILSMAFLLLKVFPFKSSASSPPDLHVPQSSLQTGATFDSLNSVSLSHAKTEELNQRNLDFLQLSLSEKLDNLSYRILGLGFPLLTVGILSGAVWANSAWGSYWSWDPKETWALITWLVFAIYLHARITKGWSGEKAAIIATLGFFVVWFSYLGVNLLGTGLHSYGWFSN